MSKKKNKGKRIGSGIFPLLLKQTISAVICFITVIAMNGSDNFKIHSYAESLGYALRAEVDTDTILSYIKERLPFFETDSPEALPGSGEVTFQ